MRIAAFMVVAAALASAQPVVAEIHAVEVVLFMPCNQETADAAIAALGEIAGVEEVQAAVGDLRVRVLVSADFTADPLSLVQVLWDMKIFPNRIYVEATAEPDSSSASNLVRVVGTGQRFALARGAAGAQDTAWPAWLRAEVLDWIEDHTPSPSSPYTLRIVEIQPSRTP